ncbi:potassium transporter TrkA [Salinigranum rubrum]|uniref:Potassium transporter TrkA n=1 Tax=Salinigranum rubrum TaxID=755307 RepID=A0A2I8VM21_9EURY|nr:TrkA C-terminal domain-containing protein [Salinigranum rubrum]AUV82982.1 potassium transporter TrkA [Salinigranum rubrum]
MSGLVFLQNVSLDSPTLVEDVARLLAFVFAAGTVSGLSALVFRWYTREPVPLGVSTVLGLSVVALYLNTVGLFSQLVVGRGATIFEFDAVVFNVVAIGLAAFATPVGRRVGDRVATDVFAVAGAKELDAEVSRIVRTVGRVTAVTLPEADDIEDMESYDPVSAELKEEMGAKTLLFPNRLTIEELRDRLITRLKDDYRVGYVDVELTERGVVEYLAVGSRAAGLGPTLGHGTVALSLRADPANAASPGDLVQVWRPGGVDPEPPESDDTDGVDPTEPAEGTRRPPERLFTAELRATNGDVVTLAADATDVGKVDATTTYRLVSLPAEPRADREFASLLRVADETMAAVTVPEGSEIVGETLGSLDVTVAAVRPASGTVQAIPTRSRLIEPGDTLYVVARPEVLRRLEARTSVVVEVPPTAAEAMEAPAD